MAVTTSEGSAPIALDGAKKFRGNLTKTRIRWVIVGLVAIFCVVGGRLVQLGLVVTDNSIEGRSREAISASRPAILDRNGLEMAVDIRVPSLYAEPRRIIDVDDAVTAAESSRRVASGRAAELVRLIRGNINRAAR